jgi:hypothetical protein
MSSRADENISRRKGRKQINFYDFKFWKLRIPTTLANQDFFSSLFLGLAPGKQAGR